MTEIIRRSRGFIIHNTRVLLMHRVKNGVEYYTLCGGKLEHDETPEQGCLREIYEETSLHVTIGEHLFTTNDTHENIYNEHFIFLCHYHGGDAKLNGEEIDRMTADNQYNPTWMPIADIVHTPIKPDIIASTLISALRQRGLIQ